MSSSADIRAATYEGLSAAELSMRLGVPRVELYEQVGSTLDVAHRIAPDAPPGTLILAEEQQAGRGRHGRRWMSPRGSGIWLTLIERPIDPQVLDVLALRCGLYAAARLEPLADSRIWVKWPNDLYVDGGKLAGVLIETRWRGSSLEWVAIGFGLNVMAPELPDARGLRRGVTRLQAVDALVPALRAAARAGGPLEFDDWNSRAYGLHRAVIEPAPGVLQGFSASGELLIRGAGGDVSAHRSGSLVFESTT